jgi:hypothetical protein
LYTVDVGLGAAVAAIAGQVGPGPRRIGCFLVGQYRLPSAAARGVLVLFQIRRPITPCGPRVSL